MRVYPEGEGVDGSLVLNLAGRLEEGGGVRGREAACAHQVHARGLGLRLAGELQEDAGVVPAGRDVVQVGVVDLEHQVLDVSVATNPGFLERKKGKTVNCVFEASQLGFCYFWLKVVVTTDEPIV